MTSVVDPKALIGAAYKASRTHYMETHDCPTQLFLSPEGEAVVREELRRHFSTLSIEEAKMFAPRLDGPFTPWGLEVEVDETLTGSEMRCA